MKIFALDLGNKQTKMISEKTIKNEKTGAKVFPSRFLYHEDLGTQGTMFKSKRKIDKYSTSKDTTFDYAWGVEINRVPNVTFLDTMSFSQRYETNEFKLLSTFALGELAKDFPEAQDTILECIVVTGVPSKDFNETTIKSLMKVLQGDHQISINDVSYNVRVKEVFVMNQPVGTIYNEMLDKEGYIQDESYFDDTVSVVDVGGGTFLVDTLSGLQLDDKRSDQKDTGIFELYDQILTRCKEDNIKGIDQYTLEQILRSPIEGSYYFTPNKNETRNITEHTLKGIQKYTIGRINVINTTIKDVTKIDKILFTGGGSNLIDKKAIKSALKYTSFVKNSEIANVWGYYKYGLAIELENKKNGE
jgi:plasmid segregation protein ParM